MINKLRQAEVAIAEGCTVAEASPPDRRHTATSGKMSGKAAYEAVKRFMTDNGHDWDSLDSCRVTVTSPALADQIASLLSWPISTCWPGRQSDDGTE